MQQDATTARRGRRTRQRRFTIRACKSKRPGSTFGRPGCLRWIVC